MCVFTKAKLCWLGSHEIVLLYKEKTTAKSFLVKNVIVVLTRVGNNNDVR